MSLPEMPLPEMPLPEMSLPEMSLPEMSAEQKSILHALELRNNVVVDSVAGSGKTTSVLHIANKFSSSKILLLTYNARLKADTRNRVLELGIKNLEVHSYHAFCVKYYNTEAHTDIGISDVVKSDTSMLEKFNYDIIAIDEVQDATKLYYNLICKIYKDYANVDTRLCILGDRRQCIFDFIGSDQRYIERGPDLFNFNTAGWVKCTLSKSHRITKEMSRCINDVFLHEDYIMSDKITGVKPRYLICSAFDHRAPFIEILRYLALGYKPEDIFVLAPSVKRRCKDDGTRTLSPINRLENAIKNTKPEIMVYVSEGNQREVNSDLIKNKIVFTTFHQVKGLERKVVIIYNFDKSYFDYYDKDSDVNKCPNVLYVAATRSIERLTFIHNTKNVCLPFVCVEKIKTHCEYVCDCKVAEKLQIYCGECKVADVKELDARYMCCGRQVSVPERQYIMCAATDLLTFTHFDILEECFGLLEITKHDDYLVNHIYLDSTVTAGSRNNEAVSDINGIVIPALAELRLKKTITIHETLKKREFEKNVGDKERINYIGKPSNNHNIDTIVVNANITLQEVIYIAICYSTYLSGFVNKMYQIPHYKWLCPYKIETCVNRVVSLNISKDAEFEHPLSEKYKVTTTKIFTFEIAGCIDCVDRNNDTVYEFKCVKKLEIDHFLQLAVYMHMYELQKKRKERENNSNGNTSYGKTKYVLYNILSNEYYTVKCSREKLDTLIVKLLYAKVNSYMQKDDEDFMSENNKIKDSYFLP